MTQIVVLAGGKATRLYPLTKETPKSLLPINGIPFIEHQIQLFKRNKISTVVLCLGTFSQKIIEHVGDGSRFGISVKYSIEVDGELLGTLGALKKAQDLLEEHFFVIWGDSYLEANYGEIMKAFLDSKKLGLMTAYRDHDNLEPSNMSLKGGMVTAYDKGTTQDGDYVDYGLSVYNKKVLDFVDLGKKLDMSYLNKRLISMNQLAVFVVDERFYEIGSFQGIKDLEDHLRSK